MRLVRTLLLSVVLVLGLNACEKAQQESAETAKQFAEELKTNTIDAAEAAAALSEKTAQEIDAAASQAEAGE